VGIRLFLSLVKILSMNHKKTLIVLLFPIVINLFIGCCYCIDETFFSYTNCSISVKNLDNTGALPVLNTNNEVIKEAFGLRINIELKEEICQSNYEHFLMPSVYANNCDCFPEDVYQATDSIVSINVKTLVDFDSTHLSMDDVSEYYAVLSEERYNYGLSGAEYVSITEFIDCFSFTFRRTRPSILELDLMLMVPPTENDFHQFEVEVVLSDERVLSGTSNLVKLL